MSENVVVQMPERETETVFLVEAGSSFELNGSKSIRAIQRAAQSSLSLGMHGTVAIRS